jgi:hypothetical protein
MADVRNDLGNLGSGYRFVCNSNCNDIAVLYHLCSEDCLIWSHVVTVFVSKCHQDLDTVLYVEFDLNPEVLVLLSSNPPFNTMSSFLASIIDQEWIDRSNE